MGSEEPLNPDEERLLRREAEAERGYPGKHGQWERLALRLLATLDAERARTVVLADALRAAAESAHEWALGNEESPKALEHLAKPFDVCTAAECVDARRTLAVLPVDRVGVEPLDVTDD